MFGETNFGFQKLTIDNVKKFFNETSIDKKVGNCSNMIMIFSPNYEDLVMVEVPAVGKAGNYLDWIARGLEMNVVKDFG